MRLIPFALVALFLAIPAPGQKLTKEEKAERKSLEREPILKERVAREWLNLAAVAVAKGSKSVALEAVGRAAALKPQDRLRVESLTRRAEAMDGDMSPADPAVEKKRVIVYRNVCRTLDQMAALEVSESNEERMEGWLWMAHALDPESKTRPKILQKLSARASQQNRQDRIRRLLEKAATIDPAGYAKDRYLPAIRAQARHSRVKIRGKGHEMDAFVLLPRAWTPRRKWPVLVYFEGPRRDYLAAALELRDALEDRDYILVVPFIISNHKALEPDWIPDPGERVPNKQVLVTHDVPGVKAVTREVQRLFSAEKTFAVSGFSVGSMLAYWWVFRRPQDLWAAAPASGHYGEICSKDAVRPTGKGPAVRVLVGDADVRGKHHRWPQNERAVAALKRIGHGHVELERVPNRAHEPFIDKVFGFLDEARKR